MVAVSNKNGSTAALVVSAATTLALVYQYRKGTYTKHDSYKKIHKNEATVVENEEREEQQQHRQRKAEERDEGTTSTSYEKFLELSPKDTLFYVQDCPPISTVTWFKGNYMEAAPKLLHRLQLVVQKNPWLLGRVDMKYHNGKCFLVCPDEAKIGKLEKEGLFISLEPTDSPISRNVTMSKLGHEIRHLVITNKPDQPVYQVTLIPCKENPNDSFALLIQMSHVIGDGHTYYTLLDMLLTVPRRKRGDVNKIVSLNAERKSDTFELAGKLLGEEESKFVDSKAFMLNFLRGIPVTKINGGTKYQFALVDKEKILSMKKDEMKKEDVEYVSTNDIITSWFMKQTNALVGLMLVGLRNRVKNHIELDAGNYENSLIYQKEDYDTPSLIRKSLNGMKRAVTPNLPGFWKLATSDGCIVSNWSTFATPNEIEDCEEDCHIPTPTCDWTATMPHLVIFRVKEGQLGVCYSQSTNVNHLDSAPFLSKEQLQ
mmetsp:Transcript_22607/g.27726  ORF Transcript_22607/g.27726 Transcript_22607/m.27726 type:complete len:485 (+) Transcript_22607:96-1550(+)